MDPVKAAWAILNANDGMVFVDADINGADAELDGTFQVYEIEALLVVMLAAAESARRAVEEA